MDRVGRVTRSDAADNLHGLPVRSEAESLNPETICLEQLRRARYGLLRSSLIGDTPTCMLVNELDKTMATGELLI